MIQSLVDYILQPTSQNHSSPHKHKSHNNSNLFDHRKLLQHFFQDASSSSRQLGSQRRISEMKFEEISTQLTYFSDKIHSQLSKKFLEIDNDLSQLQNCWLSKKIPNFYCYYYLKFSYANTYPKIQQLYKSQIQNINKQKNTYNIILKTIQARQICLSNISKIISTINQNNIQQFLNQIKEQQKNKKNKIVENQQNNYHKKNNTNDQFIKSTQNQLSITFQLISHLKKLTVYLIELIKNFKNSIYALSEDPRKFRQRIIFYHNNANYLLKITFDNQFISQTLLNQFFPNPNHYDPFFLTPCMLFENNKKKPTKQQQIIYKFLKPSQTQMQKITRALIVLAQQQYDENQQTKLILSKQKQTQLHNQKQQILNKRNSFKNKSYSNPNLQISTSNNKLDFINDKQSHNTKSQTINNLKQKNKQINKIKLTSSMNRIKQIKSVHLQKLSPYLNRNQRIAQTQKVLQLQHQFRLAQDQYADSIRKQRHQTKKTQSNQNKNNSPNKNITNNKAFTKYIEANLKLNQQANKKAFVFKNSIPQQRKTVNNVIEYNKIPFKDRKELEYEKNLQSYQKVENSMSQTINKSIKTTPSKNTKAIIQISQKGIQNKQIKSSKIQQNTSKQQQIKQIQQKLNQNHKNNNNQIKKTQNLFQTQNKQDIIILRQQPQKIQQIKQFLYHQIKSELIQEIKKNSNQQKTDINALQQTQKRQKLQQIMKQQTQQENIKKLEEFNKIQAQIDIQRKKIDLPVKVQPIQYSEESLNQYFDTIFDIFPQTYHRVFLNQSVQEKKNILANEFYLMFLKGSLNGQEIAHAIVKYDWTFEKSRKLKIEYVAVNSSHYFMSSFHQFCQYIWQNDPADYIELVVYKHLDNQSDKKIHDDLQQYCQKRAQTFEKTIYSNITQVKFLQSRPQEYADLYFPQKNLYFSKLLNLKCQLLSSAINLNQKIAPKMDMNLETFTNYIFLLQELFRKYLTPQEVVELRENSNNILRLKDIFRIVLELETSNPIVDQLKIVQGLNLEDLYQKLKQKVNHPYNKYYWPNFYDRTMQNRLLLSILEFKLELQYSSNSCELDNKKYMRINPISKVLTLKSSIYSKQLIYILKTKHPKIKMFIMDAQYYKLMRIELFVFLNLVFNNIVQDQEIFINSIWIPQFVITNQGSKQVKRITDFSISMKKNFYLSQEIYFANYQYIRNGISFIPKQTDIIYNKSFIIGFLHNDIENASTGMPIYAKMIDQTETFNHSN